MGLCVSSRQERVLQSDIRTMTIACERLGGINLSQGVCDTPVPDPVLEGARKAIKDGINIYTHYAGLKGLRTAIAQKQRRFTGLEPYVPQGAYYVLANITGVPGADGRERAMHILERTGVACVPGSAFFHGASGEGLARFCFAKEDHILDEACRRIARLS